MSESPKHEAERISEFFYKSVEDDPVKIWTQDDAVLLQDVIRMDVVRKALNFLYHEAEGSLNGILSSNLENPEERAEATRVQGRVAGARQTIQRMFELSDPEAKHE